MGRDVIGRDVPRRAGPPSLARERGGTFRVEGGTRSSAAAEGPSEDDGSAVTALEVATDAVVAADLDDLDDAEVRARLRRLQRCIDRLTGLRATATGLLEQRALRQAGPGRESQALRVTRQTTSDELRLSPAQVARDGTAGRQVAARPAQAAALRAGDLTADHARLLADTLRDLPPDLRDPLEAELLRAAETQDPLTFGRTCRRRFAEIAPASATEAQQRRNARRGLRIAATPEGMLALSGQGSGLAAETIATAIHAFRRPDAAGERRRPEQATFDALVDVCRTALDHGTAPTDRCVRPHVLVTIDHTTLIGGREVDSDGRPAITGVAETTWTGPLPYSEVRRLLHDAGVARLLVDARGLPLEASEEVRTVPAGLWRALLVRDRTCIGHRCTVPAAWCQVMHLDVPYRLQGRLSPDNAALGCSYHHRMLDHHGWQARWTDGRPSLHPPGEAATRAATSREPAPPALDRPPPPPPDRSRASPPRRPPPAPGADP